MKRKVCIGLSLVILSILFAASSISAASEDTEYDTIMAADNATIISVDPSSNDAPISGNVVITFSAPMDPSYGTVWLNSLPALTGEIWSDSDTVFIIPYSGLAYSTAYTVSIGDFMDAGGTTIGFDDSNEFFTTTGPLAFTDNQSYDIPASTVGTAITNIDLSVAVSGG
ncbi:MAG: Ig-like domain-containing protein, partial [Methanomassiliicoccaceae archaeon]|nr:Ig-like domain-containing protein [Methanomassiliicoccaceae archaeon]